MGRIFYTTAFLAGFFSVANAAEIKTFTSIDTDDSRKNATYISIVGNIDFQDEIVFRKVLKRAKNVRGIYLHSYGGNAFASIEIAEEVLNNNLITMVPHGGQCHSGCAIIFLMGRDKFMLPNANISIHSVHEEVKDEGGKPIVDKNGKKVIAPIDQGTMEYNSRITYLFGKAGYSYELAKAWVMTPGYENFKITNDINNKWNLKISYIGD